MVLVLPRLGRSCSYQSTRYLTLCRKGIISRHYLSPTIVVPPHTKLERPYTVVLAEDIGLFDDGPEQIDASWGPRFASELPSIHGIPFQTWRPSSSTPFTLDDTQSELESDLQNIQRLILVARGPILSWMASFYLESCPAAGIILVDPLSFTDEELIESPTTRQRFMDEYLQYQNVIYPLQARHQRLIEYIRNNKGWDEILFLEPGSVPMAVFSTMHIRKSWKFHAHLMAARHTTLSYALEDDDNPEVPVIGLKGRNDPELVDAVSDFCIHRARW